MNRTASIALALTLGAAATGCTTKTTHMRETIATSKLQPELELRAYDVPKGSAERYRTLLQQLLSGGKRHDAVARVAVGPDGQLVVAGPKAVQQGVSKILESAHTIPGAASVELTYWIVAARPAPTLTFDDSLKDIGVPLAALSKSHGGLAFRSIDRISMRSSPSTSASHSGRRTEVRQTVRQVEDKLEAELRIRSNTAHAGWVDTLIPLAPSQPVIVGDMGVDPDVWPGSEGEGDTQLFYLVRANVDG
jgi:hypothetical protein